MDGNDQRETDMTFEEFQATKTFHEDLSKALPDYYFGEDPPTPRGYVYCGQLVIEEITEGWPQESRDAGKFYLALGSSETIQSEIEPLERMLYEYALDEGFGRK